MVMLFSGLKFSGEGLVQQRLLQHRQRSKIQLAEAGEALSGGGVHDLRRFGLYPCSSIVASDSWPTKP